MTLQILNWKDATTYDEIHSRMMNLLGKKSVRRSDTSLHTFLTKDIIKLVYGHLKKAEVRDDRLLLDVIHYPYIIHYYGDPFLAIEVSDSNDVSHETSLDALMKYSIATAATNIKLYSILTDKCLLKVNNIDTPYIAMLVMTLR